MKANVFFNFHHGVTKGGFLGTLKSWKNLSMKANVFLITVLWKGHRCLHPLHDTFYRTANKINAWHAGVKKYLLKRLDSKHNNGWEWHNMDRSPHTTVSKK